jgi:hypothetical protein
MKATISFKKKSHTDADADAHIHTYSRPYEQFRKIESANPRCRRTRSSLGSYGRAIIEGLHILEASKL